MSFLTSRLCWFLMGVFAVSTLQASYLEDETRDNGSYPWSVPAEITPDPALFLSADHPSLATITDETLLAQLTLLPLTPIVQNLSFDETQDLIQALLLVPERNTRAHVVTLLRKDALRRAYQGHLPGLVTFLAGIDVSIKRMIAAYLAEKSLEQALCFAAAKNFPSSNHSRPLKIYGPKEHGW
ncbi:MAG: hypothetical protein H2057_03145 [Alphaproteobacteria bacterium]|nr:hypothetical protein [Alphaproteobacteria bacterium]